MVDINMLIKVDRGFKSFRLKSYIDQSFVKQRIGDVSACANIDMHVREDKAA